MTAVFKNIFYSDSGEYDYEPFRPIFDELITSATGMHNDDYGQMLNSYFNTVIITYLQNEILHNLAGLFGDIGDMATRKEIWDIYKSTLQGNLDSILAAGFENYFDGTSLDYKNRLVVDHEAVIKAYSEYFIKVRQNIFIEATNAYTLANKNACAKLIRAFTAIAELKCGGEEFIDACIACGKQAGCDNIGDYVLIIEHTYAPANTANKGTAAGTLAYYPFSSAKFIKEFNYWSLNKSLSVIDFQRRYLLAVIPKDRNYNRRRKELLACINMYEKRIKQIKASQLKNKQYLEQLYAEAISGGDIDAEIMNLI